MIIFWDRIEPQREAIGVRILPLVQELVPGLSVHRITNENSVNLRIWWFYLD